MRRGQPKTVLPVGKLPLEHLRRLLSHVPKHDPRLLVGPQIGEDAAVIDAGNRYLVVATDPITFATDHIGRYVHRPSLRRKSEGTPANVAPVYSWKAISCGLQKL